MKKMWINLLFLPLLFFIIPFPAEAEEGIRLKLSELVKEALEHNPKIAAAKSAWEAKEARIGQVDVLDDPEIGVDSWNIPTDVDLSETRNWIFFARQRFPSPGTLPLRAAGAKAEALQTKAALESARRSVISAVKISYSDLYLAHETIKVTEEHLGILRRFEAIARVKFSTGSVSQQDLLKAQVALARLENEQVTLEQRLNAARAALNTLLNRLPRSPLGRPESLEIIRVPADLDLLETIALRERPKLKKAKAAITHSKQEVALAKKKFFPDFQISVKRFQNRGIPQPNGWGISASINVPWFFHQKHDQRIQETRHRTVQQEALYENLKNQTRFAIEDLLLKIQTAERLATLFQDNVIPKATQSVASAEIGYQADQVDFLDLLESQRQMVTFRLEYFSAVTLQNQEAARLEQVVGVDLFDLKIEENGGSK